MTIPPSVTDSNTDSTELSRPPRTYVHTEFDAAALAESKREQGLSISVVIPARNEEATVGDVVARLRTATMENSRLVDELVVIDGDSSDRTAEVAAQAGAVVIGQSEILPAAGNRRGKGEALWKGLAATHGDLIAYVDADIHDVDERFVTGTLGPLLLNPSVSFVKATYDRPFQLGDQLHPAGGGRVTELLARPLLAAFWPELSFIAQPLAGEYAGRRSLLEALPYICGYGVEIGLLIDIAQSVGADAIAQVDLGQRVHDHQPLDALGRMASELLHVAMGRLAASGRGAELGALSSTLWQPVRAGDGALKMASHTVEPDERPPLRDWLNAAG